MSITDLLLSSYNYQLPQELIAQTPVVPRDSSRLLVVDSPNTYVNSIFQDLPKWLSAGDLLVLNNTKVIPARLYGRKSTGAPVEILLLEEKGDNRWLCLVKPGKRFTLGSEIHFQPKNLPVDCADFILKAKVLERDESTSGRILAFELPESKSLLAVLDGFGNIPLPPYIGKSDSQPSQYQTIYAQQLGAVAAPTAGLHFTEELLTTLKDGGIETTELTLHVGVGTFRPVEVEDITTHQMHEEWIEVPEITVEKIQQTKARGGRVIAVGTTVIRALEGAALHARNLGKDGLFPFTGKTNLFIYPGYSWQIIDGAITNFHLPQSSLLMLISALIGRERLLDLYQKAIEEKYRFYSFGDAMLILPSASYDRQ